MKGFERPKFEAGFTKYWQQFIRNDFYEFCNTSTGNYVRKNIILLISLWMKTHGDNKRNLNVLIINIVSHRYNCI